MTKEDFDKANKPSMFQLSVDSQVLIDELRKVPVSEIVSWDALSAAIGRDVRAEAMHNLQTARRHVQHNYGMVFGTVYREGLKRLSDSETVDSGDRSVVRVHNEARRGMRRLACVQDYEKLPAPQKVKHNALMSILGVLSKFTLTKSVKQITDTASAEGRKLSLQHTIEAFSKSKDEAE